MSADPPITVLLVDDQRLIRDALRRLLDLEPDLQVVGDVADGHDAVSLAGQLHPAVALVDIEMPGMDGFATAEAIRTASPTTAVAMLTTFGRPGYLERAMRLGVAGFLLKEEPVPVLAHNIRRLAAGERVIDAELAVTALAEGPNPLTAREQDILRRVAAGDSVPNIARALFLTPGTVRNYLSAAMDKLGATNRMQAVREAERRGWL